jgi:hypothetical protein
MKKSIILIVLLAIAFLGEAQEIKGFGLFTDRDTYVSGETLLAQIYHPAGNQSKIAYLDLVNPWGKRVSGVSLEIKNNRTNGFLSLPDSLSSGSYLLRAYLKNSEQKTKIIRNIWISNRFTGFEKTKQLSYVSGQKNIQEKQCDQIAIHDIKETYPTKSNIVATLKFDKTLLDQVDGPVSVSVAQTNAEFRPTSFIWNSSSKKEELTENKGIILTGTITDKKTTIPVSNATVFLTIPDSIPEFQYYQTQSDGRFYFMLEGYHGDVQAFIQCYNNTPLQSLKINMDELFAETDSLPVYNQSPISEEFIHTIEQSIDAVTFQKVFNQDKLKLQEAQKKATDSYPFYGKPSNIVNPQLFIDLPNFSEISKELLPGVKFRNYNNDPTLRVMNSWARNYFDENPLILIDGIPIRNLNIIKDMGTSDIKRVEILQCERYFGNLRFPGVVAIYTMKGDYSRIPDSDQFIRVKIESNQIQARLKEPEITDASIPDLRQVFYWNPAIEPNEDISVNFNTSSILGTFDLVVRGKLKDGTIIRADKQFEVK